jgi:lipopolysaccharide/colanic/teichoic acid biosynthesis glycosyltransferase
MPSPIRRKLVIILLDLLIALFAFWFARYFGHLPKWYWLVLSAVLWVVVGHVSGKLRFDSYKRRRYAFLGILIMGILTGVSLYFFYKACIPDYAYDYSILLATGIIILLEWALYCSIRRLVYRKIPFFYEEPVLEGLFEAGINNTSESKEKVGCEDLDRILKIIEEKKNIRETEQWIKGHPELFASHTVILDSTHPESILAHKTKSPQLIVLLSALNEIRHINTFLSYSNYCLDTGGYIVCHCTTAGIRKKKILTQNPVGINYMIYFLDYCWHRVAPKLSFSKPLYYGLTKGNKRALTRVEILGRIYRAGFDVVYEEICHGEFYVAASKIKEPIRDDKPSSGLLIRLKRIGKGGKTIGVYKFRTMHAYSEYIQGYVYKQSVLVKGDKIANDYRVNSIGRYLRKFWIDELPQLINWIKGDIKLVGVRPLSQHKFSLYSKELQELRIKTKPGLLPPYYYDMPESLEEMEASEIRYLKSYLKHPFLTDWKYFWKIVENIVVRGKRSK